MRRMCRRGYGAEHLKEEVPGRVQEGLAVRVLEQAERQAAVGQDADLAARSFGSRLLEQPADSADDAVEQSAVARSRNPASGGVLGQGVSGRLFGSAVRSPSSIILPKLGTSERRVEFVVDAPFLAGDFEGFAEDSRSEEHTSELQSLMRISY